MISRDDFIRPFIALSFPVTLSRTSGHLGFRGNKGEGVRVYSVERGARKQREDLSGGGGGGGGGGAGKKRG